MNFRQKKAILTSILAIVLFFIATAKTENDFLVRKSLIENYLSVNYKYADSLSVSDFSNALLFVSSSKNASTELLNSSLLLAESFSVFENYESTLLYIDIALKAADSLHHNFDEKKQLLLLKSNALEKLNKTEKALDLWREILKRGEDFKDINISYYAIYNLIRIYNNQSNPERARIYSDVLNSGKIGLFPSDFNHLFQLELLRLSVKKGNLENAKTTFNELYNQTHLAIEHIDLEIFMKLFIYTEILNFDDQLIQNLAVVIEEKVAVSKKLKLKLEAALLLGHYYQKFNPAKGAAYFFLAEKASDEYYQKKLKFSESLTSLEKSLETTVINSSQNDESRLEMPFILLTFFTLLILGIVALVLIKSKSIKKKFDISVESFNEEKLEVEKKINHLDKDIDSQISDRIETLKNEIHERERIDEELQDALEKAEKANFLKNAFLGNMSHEIRTPLNGILGFSSLLETELALLENTDLYEYANSIQKSGERLLHLLNNIIDISRLEANDIEMNIAACDLSVIIDNVIEGNKFRANDKGIKIVKDIKPFIVDADKPTLSRVLNEIVDNAIKYTEKGFIKISVNQNIDNSSIQITIKDSGIGIDSNYLPYIFEAFRQESMGYTRQYQGAGLGIPLAKRLISKMDGQFSIVSEKSIGTEVKIDLPLHKGDNAEMVSKDKSENSVENILKGKRVLIVEDDLASRTILVRIIKKVAEVTEAKDGEEAYQITRTKFNNEEFFDLMLFDINLPAPWDGIKLMQTIKNQFHKYQNIPFIAQTAYGMVGDKERIIEAGFNGYVSKPIQKGQLFNEIGSVLEKD
jgi:signal transduction histidine kinase/CheY-like chemotaxis protein